MSVQIRTQILQEQPYILDKQQQLKKQKSRKQKKCVKKQELRIIQLLQAVAVGFMVNLQMTLMIVN